MALDEAIKECVADHRSLPTLRLYSWAPPCLSLGYAQSYRDIDLDRLNQRGWHLVRRPTGGKAILHCNELTYSISAPLDEPRVAGTVLESYCRLSRGLIRALALLNIHAHADSEYPQHDKMQIGPVCFEIPSNYEITVNGKKVIGSAQARRGNGLLQHGSLPLVGNIALIVEALVFETETERQVVARKIHQRAGNLSAILGYEPKIIAVEDALIEGFSQELALDLIEAQPSDEELDLTNKLMKDKYNCDSWNLRN